MLNEKRMKAKIRYTEERLNVGENIMENDTVKVDVDQIATMPEEKKLPTAKELCGLVPDFTGDMKTEDYIRSLRE